MKITYQVQRIAIQPTWVRRGWFIDVEVLQSRRGVLFVSDGFTPFAVKAAIEESHPGWYAAFWKTERNPIAPTSDEQSFWNLRRLIERRKRAQEHLFPQLRGAR